MVRAAICSLFSRSNFSRRVSKSLTISMDFHEFLAAFSFFSKSFVSFLISFLRSEILLLLLDSYAKGEGVCLLTSLFYQVLREVHILSGHLCALPPKHEKFKTSGYVF